VTGAVDGFEWKAPVDAIGRGDDTPVIEERTQPEAAEAAPVLEEPAPRRLDVVEVRPKQDEAEAPETAPAPPPPRSEPRLKPEIFVPERPPDDPGVGQAEADESPSSLERLRAAQIR
jgi:uncharacterized membrane-anchored protein